MCQLNMKRYSIRFHLVPCIKLESACRSLQRPKNLLNLRKAFEPVGHYYLCHVDEIHATKEYNAGSVKHDTRKKKYYIKDLFVYTIQMEIILVQKVMVTLYENRY